MKKLYILFITIFITTLSFGQLVAGDIAFIGFNGDGDDDFAIVALKDIPASTIIYFSDEEPNVAGNGFLGTTEGILKWISGSVVIEAGTVVVFTDVDNGTNASFGSSIGSLSDYDSGLNLATGGDTLYAVIGDPLTNNISAWIAGIRNNNVAAENFASTGLTKGLNFVEMKNTAGGVDGGQYSGSKAGEISFSNYLSLIGNASNWTTDNDNGESFLPFSTTAFSIATASVTKNQIDGFAMYPNPVANGRFSISSNSNADKFVEIYSLLGKQVYSKNVKASQTIEVSNLSRGVYILRVEEEGKIATRKLVIQ